MTSIQPTLVALRGVLLLLAMLAGVPGCGDDGPEGVAVDYDVEISASGDGRFGALQFRITHLGHRGEFIGRGDKVDCEVLVEAISAVNYLDDRTVTAGMISLAGVQMPAAIFRCGFRTSEDLEAEFFGIEVTDAADISSQPLDPLPEVEVTDVSPR